MCKLCSRAALKIAKAERLPVREAIDWLWSHTAFPVADGRTVLDQVEAYLRVRRRNRRRWLRKFHARCDRDALAADAAADSPRPDLSPTEDHQPL